MLSIWERNSFVHYNHIIIGGGIVGLSTAIYLQQKNPTHQILVLERGFLPTGASTKNAGFACMGSASELLDDLKNMTEKEVLELFLLRKIGLERLRGMLGDTHIGYKEQGSYELLRSEDIDVLDKLDYLNELLQKEIQCNAFSIATEKIHEFGFNHTEIKALIKNNCEGELDTGLMMKVLIKKAHTSGIEIKTNSNVLSYTEEKEQVIIHIEHNMHLTCNNLLLCTNAFTKQFLPTEDITPGRGQVLLTKPIPSLAFKGIFHYQKGYYYFREYKGCILFGGGRHKHIEEETTTQLELNNAIQADLETILKTIIIPNTPFEIDLRWSGIMAFGKTKQPILKKISERVYAGVRMGGMGVAIGSEVGYTLASMVE